MDEKIKKRIQILLSNAIVAPINDSYGRRSSTIEDIVSIDEVKKAKVIEKPEEWFMTNDHASTLIKLYRQLPRKDQVEMLELLKGFLINNSSYLIKIVVTLVLVNTDNANPLINTIVSNFRSYNQEGLKYSMLALARTLKYQPHLFAEEDVEALHYWTEAYLNRKSEVGKDASRFHILYEDFERIIILIREKTVTILSRNFTNQIDLNFNPDINTDEVKIKDLFVEFGFPIDMVESLNHINDQLNNGDTPFKFKNTMDSIRAFTERLFEMVAKSINPDSKIDGKNSEAAVKYFREKGLIAEDMASLITSLRHFLSNNGVHRLKSRREDARIAKNLVVEISLYLITRLKEL